MVTIVDGEVLSAQKINDLLNHTLLEPKSYTATVGGATGTATATYLRIGKRVEVEFTITFGGVSTGTVTLSTPTAMAGTASGTALGSAFAVDVSVGASSRRSLTVLGLGNLTTVAFLVDSLGSSAAISGNTPWAWANGDTISGRFTYWEA